MRTVGWFLVSILLTALLAACGDSEFGLSCTDPALLGGTPSDLSPLYIVTVIDGVEIVAETHRMEMAYGFTSSGISEFVQTFSADLTPSQLTMVRCDDAVAGAFYNSVFYPTE